MAPTRPGNKQPTAIKPPRDAGVNPGISEELLKTRAYFNRLKIRLGLGVLACFIIPHVLLSVYFHCQFTTALKKTGKINIEALAKSQRNIVDLFLREREMNLRNLFYSREFTPDPTDQKMLYFLQTLNHFSDAFVDVGFLNHLGVQTGYAGPFPALLNKNYRKEAWFSTLLAQEKDYVITNVYLGFRNKPHFTIAVKLTINNRVCIMRSTLDPDKFYMFLRSIGKVSEVETTLVNQAGTYQLVDPLKANVLERSTYLPPRDVPTGIYEIKDENGVMLTAHAWLTEAPWALIISQPLKIIHAQMYKTRNAMIINLSIITIFLALVIWITASRLMNRAQRIAEESIQLQTQLIHASKLASVGELATGVAHEINNPLAIITSTVGVVRDMLNPEFNLDSSPGAIVKELKTIESAAFRASRITRQLLDFGRKNEPKKEMHNINNILETVRHGLTKHRFDLADIKIETNYAQNLPDIKIDADQISQVFLNLLNNAEDAIKDKGTITISTDFDNEFVRVMIQDTGEGMPLERIKEIFNPFYTTKEAGKGTGLGLSISLGIINAMKGTIEVQSLPGKGSLFTISLPADTTKSDPKTNNHDRGEKR
ncbi:two-component sensory box histidine kinase/response regulator [Desulforapulum autotrophicum HRM2]|uniref:histidine kinase n=1 Tax=Desulforapulum autotrophicum (strain ATCC 43914 / DSM 3382 / VKM B-1955 / HRM2) TaxID=177437 RepID=C0QAT8_DESAH|nr:ATP-binding protein [Desulforapulum autotrophicum]ACN16871.1 two-component sensory box histidine kinase/response regulator [Desulforapulum autotrophicum HRM2]